MAHARQSRHKSCRRFGGCLFGSVKCPVQKRPTRPGVHGKTPIRSLSEFGRQLLMKQKMRIAYGVREKQFRRYFRVAQKAHGVVGDNLLQILERRFDNVIYRLGYARTRSQARQFVSHGLFSVNGKRVTIPSYSVSVGDVISISAGKEKSGCFASMSDARKDVQTPCWLQIDPKKGVGKVLSLPERDDAEKIFDVNLVVEYYSK